jgi:PD-(D/E)XK nuclease superfamily
MTQRHTIVVHGRLVADQVRLDAARHRQHGVQITSMAGMAARLAGGFLRGVDGDTLSIAVGAVLGEAPPGALGDLEPIRGLPGLQLALARTLGKAWRAGLDLKARTSEHPRFATLAAIEAEVLGRLPRGMLRPTDLAVAAAANLRHAPAILGAIEVRGMTALEPVWQGLLTDIAKHIPVAWNVGPREAPGWLDGTTITLRKSAPVTPTLEMQSCATARHEVIEALRWARALLAAGAARVEEVAIAAASPGAYDDIMEAAAADATLPLHFAHGRRALNTRDGQAAAALADILVRGLSQDRVRRLVALARAPGTALSALPEGWRHVLPEGAPLNTPLRWQQLFATAGDSATPVAAVLMPVIDRLHQGPEAAEQAGETLLSGVARTLWRRALGREAPGAIERALVELRVPDSTDPACSIVWAPAAELAACPRPHARLLGLNAQTWPRNAMEDPSLPGHLVPPSLLDALPLAEADRRDFRTIGATTTTSLVLSFSRRDATCRLLGRSPLLDDGPETHLRRAPVPDHAMSEADRLMARPGEFAVSARARTAIGCWQDWLADDITSHDGVVRPDHPAITRVLSRTHSATSLQMLLRNPLGFVWKYVFELRTPPAEEEPFRLDPLTFGTLTHEILDAALQSLEASPGLGAALPNAIAAAVVRAAGQVGQAWQAATAIPPPLLWRATLTQAAALATTALSYPLAKIDGQQSWSEVHFNDEDVARSRPTPWDQTRRVEIAGTGLVIGGKIDRLDLSADRRVARVIDYKTGAMPKDIADRVLAGGRELQRCLYAFAVQSLLGDAIKVEAALLYPRGQDAYHALSDPKTTLDDLKVALQLAAANLRAGRALPGPDTGGAFDDLAFALLAREGARLDRKLVQARALLGEAATIWEVP